MIQNSTLRKCTNVHALGDKIFKFNIRLTCIGPLHTILGRQILRRGETMVKINDLPLSAQ